MAGQSPSHPNIIDTLKLWVDNQSSALEDLKFIRKQVFAIDNIVYKLEDIIMTGGKTTDDPVIVEKLVDIMHRMHVSARKLKDTITSGWQASYYQDTLNALERLGLHFTQSSSSMSSSSEDSWINELNFDGHWFFVQLSHPPNCDKIIAIRISDSITSKETPPVFHMFNSDACLAACAFAKSSIFVYGGEVSVSGSDTLRECKVNQFDSIQSSEWVPLSSSTSPPRAFFGRPFSLTVGKPAKQVFLYGSCLSRCDGNGAYLCDLETSEWLEVADPAIVDWFVINLFTWTNPEEEEEIVAVLRNSTELKHYDQLQLRSYNWKENRWDVFSYITCSHYYGIQHFVVSGSILFHIRGAKWRVYDLIRKETKGFVQGLESLLDIPGINLLEDGSDLQGVANLNNPYDLHFKFCVGWMSNEMSCLNFALIGIKDQGDQLLGKIISYGRVELDMYYILGQCTGFCPLQEGSLLENESGQQTQEHPLERSNELVYSRGGAKFLKGGEVQRKARSDSLQGGEGSLPFGRGSFV